jgi:hypothetical protein
MSDMLEYTIIFSIPFWRGASRGLDVSYQALTSRAYSAIVSCFKETYGRGTRVANKHFAHDHSNTVAKKYGIDVEVRDRCRYAMNRNMQQQKAAAARLLATAVAKEIYKELRVTCKKRNEK